MKEFDSTIAMEYFMSECRKYGIRVKKFTNDNFRGTYWVFWNSIKAPRPIDVISFGVCIHELFHGICRHEKRKYDSTFEEEIAAEKYALKIIQELGWDNTEYKKRAEQHLFGRVKEYLSNKNLTLLIKFVDEGTELVGDVFIHWTGRHEDAIIIDKKINQQTVWVN